MSVIFQPVLQQNSVVLGQAQRFWNIQKLIPSFIRSVERQVGLVLSKICTPVSISLVITASEAWKAPVKLAFQVKVFPG